MAGHGEMRLNYDPPSKAELEPLEFDLSGFHAIADEIRRQMAARREGAEPKQP